LQGQQRETLFYGQTGAALDQAQTVSVTDNNNTLLCHNNCLKVKETTPFEPRQSWVQNIRTKCRLRVWQWIDINDKI